VAWKKDLPGTGWSSPAIGGGKMYLTAAVPESGGYSLRALCLDAASGEVKWDVEVFKQDAKAAKIHPKNSHASPTAIVEGEKVYVHFGHMGTACLNAKDGSKAWADTTHRYAPVHGNGGSPIVVGDKLIFSTDGTDKQLVIGLNKATGKQAWATPRNAGAGQPFSFSTPTLITVGSQEQVISPGSGVVMSLDPKSGREIWRVKYQGGYSVIPKPVYGDGLVYVCTGYNTPQLMAIKVNGKGDVTGSHVAWTVRKNVPHSASLLLVDGAIYMVSDKGTLTCLDAKTGTEKWSESVGGNYSASPIYAGGLIYLLSEEGVGTVFRPGDGYEMVSRNALRERTLASYALDGDALFIRSEKNLYRIEKK
jgi:outer membrane protein assembly factor BamB